MHETFIIRLIINWPGTGSKGQWYAMTRIALIVVESL